MANIPKQPIQNLQPGVKFMNPDGTATFEFQRIWAQLLQQINESITQIIAQVVQLQAVQQSNNANAQLVNTAQNAADSAAGGAARSDDATASLVIVPYVWTPGPTANLLTVSAGDLTASVTMYTDQISSTAVNALGQYRIVELPSETVMFTGDFTVSGFLTGTVFPFSGPSPFSGGLYQLLITDQSVAALKALNTPGIGTGSIDYRLDFIMSTPGVQVVTTAYLYARRA
jgi:hypothetical protein